MLLKKTRLVKSPKSRKNLFWTFLKLEFFGTFRVVKDDPKKGFSKTGKSERKAVGGLGDEPGTT